MYVQVIEGRLKSEDGWRTIEELEQQWREHEAQRAPGSAGSGYGIARTRSMFWR